MGIVRTPWTRQPQTPVGVNWGNPHASTLKHAFVPDGYSYRDLVTGKRMTAGSSNQTTIEIKAKNEGYSRQDVLRAPLLGAGYAYGGFTLPSNSSRVDQIAGTDRYTFLFLGGAWTASTAHTHMFGVNDPLVTGAGFVVSFDDNQVVGPGRLRIVGMAATSSGQVLPTVLRDRIHFCGAAYQGGADIRFYANRTTSVVSQAGTVAAANSSRRIFIGNPQDGANFGSAGCFIGLGLIFEGVLSDQSYAALYDNPWQLIAPLSRQIWATPSAGAAANTITASTLPGGYGYMGSGQTRAIQPSGLSYMG